MGTVLGKRLVVLVVAAVAAAGAAAVAGTIRYDNANASTRALNWSTLDGRGRHAQHALAEDAILQSQMLVLQHNAAVGIAAVQRAPAWVLRVLRVLRVIGCGRCCGGVLAEVVLQVDEGTLRPCAGSAPPTFRGLRQKARADHPLPSP